MNASDTFFRFSFFVSFPFLFCFIFGVDFNAYLYLLNIYVLLLIDSPTRPASTVVLPMSLDDDMSDSGDSWGSDFDESGDVEENEIYEVLGQPREKVGTVS